MLADGTTEMWDWRNDEAGLCYEVHVDGNLSEQLCSGDMTTAALGVSPTNDDGQRSWDAPAAVGVAPDGTVSIDGGEVTFGGEVDGGRSFVWEFSEGRDARLAPHALPGRKVTLSQSVCKTFR